MAREVSLAKRTINQVCMQSQSFNSANQKPACGPYAKVVNILSSSFKF